MKKKKKNENENENEKQVADEMDCADCADFEEGQGMIDGHGRW